MYLYVYLYVHVYVHVYVYVYVYMCVYLSAITGFEAHKASLVAKCFFDDFFLVF